MKLERILIIPDCHRPFHHELAWRLMIKIGRFVKPDRIIVLGDFADLASFSMHEPDDVDETTLKEELTSANEGLDELDALGARHKHFISGNHTQRMIRFLARHAPQLAGVVTMPKLLRLEERGWTWTPYRKTLKIGKVNFTHDTGKSGQNAHRAAAASYMASAVIGHTHRCAYEVRGRINGSAYVAAMFGWLGDPDKITYTHEANAHEWAHGIGLGFHDTATGVIHLQPVPFVGGKACVLGRLI